MRHVHALMLLLPALAMAGCSQMPPVGSQANAEPAVVEAPGPVARVPLPAPRAQALALASQPVTVTSVADHPYRLDAGDRLRVVVYGQEGLTNSYAVDAAGNISMPLIGAVPARGLTVQQLGNAIGAKLRQGFIREPHVAVEVDIYRPFFILGEVTFPGQYPYVANMTVETAVAIAGGFSPRAKRSEVDIARPYGGQIARATVPVFTAVKPGDTITVGERWF